MKILGVIYLHTICFSGQNRSGGPYAIGKRMKLDYIRAMITAALEGRLEKVAFEKHSVFGILMPTGCAGVPSQILNPKNTWSDKTLYDKWAKELARLFITNFEKYASGASEVILAATPIA